MSWHQAIQDPISIAIQKGKQVFRFKPGNLATSLGVEPGLAEAVNLCKPSRLENIGALALEED